jgi:chromosomal replication initiator protein
MNAVDYDRLWQTVLGDIEISLSRANYVTWFKNTRLVDFADGVATIGVQNVFIKQQLERKYADVISTSLEKNDVHTSGIVFKIQASAPRSRETDERAVFQQIEKARMVPGPGNGQHRTASPLTHTYRQGLNEKYRFENFIVGSGNELAYAACQAVAADPGKKYNPLFLYGGAGIGKTHLIQAVGTAVLANRPGSHVVYVSSEQFVQEFVDALRFKKNTDFADYYRSADVLIVDDVQFLAGKEKIQEEFFHTFNALHQANKQIIISSDKPPREIPTLEERLRSRFVWGMSIDMQNPDFETRCAIIQSKAEEKNTVLPSDVVEYLSTQFQTNIRELEGALNQVLAFCEMRDLSPNLAIVSGSDGSEIRSIGLDMRSIAFSKLKESSSKATMVGLVFVIISTMLPIFTIIYTTLGPSIGFATIEKEWILLTLLVLFPCLDLVLMLLTIQFSKSSNLVEPTLDMFGIFISIIIGTISNNIVILALGFICGIYIAKKHYYKEQKKEEIEKMLPDTLLAIGIMPKGVGLIKIIQTLIKNSSGQLRSELEITLKQIENNIGFRLALSDLYMRNGSQLLKRSCQMLEQLVETNNTDKISLLAQDLIITAQTLREKSVLFSMQKYTLLIGSLLLPLMLSSIINLAFSVEKINNTTKVLEKIEAAKFSIPTYLVIYSAMSAFVISTSEGKKSSFSIYLLIMSATSLFIFNFIKI